MGVPISSLPAASALTGAELLPVVQSGQTKQTTTDAIPYVPAGTGAVTTTVQSKLRETVSVKDFGAVGGNGSVDTPAIQAALAAYKCVHFPAGYTYVINANTTVSADHTLIVDRGAIIQVETGVTLTINGEVFAGNYQIFSGSGSTVMQTSTSVMNVTWWPGSSLNAKWDAMKTGFVSFRPKQILIPKPEAGASWATEQGGTGWWQWDVTAPVIFTDVCNDATVRFEGELFARTNIGAVIRFDDAAKPENIDFPLGVKIRADATNRVTVGIDIRSGSRLSFGGLVDINYADTPVSIGGASQSAPCEQIQIQMLHHGYASVQGVLITGTASFPTQQIQILWHYPENFAAATKDAVVIKGTVNNAQFPFTFYATNLGNNAGNVFYIASTADGNPKLINIGSVYASDADNGVKTENSGGSSRIEGLSIGVVRINGASGVNIDYAAYPLIHGVGQFNTITIGANTQYADVAVSRRYKSTSAGSITDNGLYTTINNFGKQANGVGAPPSTGVWAIGNIVRNTDDGKVYVKIQDTGVSASDFVVLN